jgi:cytidine deaminase
MKLDPDMRQQLIERALKARERAYAPYSNYFVGAALLTKSGKIFDGCNIENVGFTSTICAERTAVFKAVSEGEKEFEVMAVASLNGGFPCAVCRQVLAEFGMDILIIGADENGKVTHESPLTDLYPHAFTPSALLDRDD